jgi:hypothetical protein
LETSYSEAKPFFIPFIEKELARICCLYMALEAELTDSDAFSPSRKKIAAPAFTQKHGCIQIFRVDNRVQIFLVP